MRKAEFQSEPYDGVDIFAPYSRGEREDYIYEKSMSFSGIYLGRYVVVQNSRNNRMVMPFMYLVDRRKTKRMWWSPDAAFAMVFTDKAAAEQQAKKYKYNNVRVRQITSFMTKH